jgi:hypothetical protein
VGLTRGRASADIEDVDLAAYLSAMAFIEIRYLAGRAMRDEVPSAEALARIRLLADLGHNLPFNRRPWRGQRRLTSFERAMQARRTSWVWNTANAEKREWILGHIDKAGSQWTPPPPLPTKKASKRG